MDNNYQNFKQEVEKIQADLADDTQKAVASIETSEPPA